MSRRRSRTRTFVAAALLTSVCGACSTILGIEPLDAGPLIEDSGSQDSTTGADSPGTDSSSTDGTATDAPRIDGGMDASQRDASDAAPLPDASDGGLLADAAATSTDASFNTAPLDGVTVATTGVQFATGNAQQVHAVYANHDQRVWYFYIDSDQTKIKSMASVDRQTWTAATSIPLTQYNTGYGNNFSVAYEDVAGIDVVHLVVSQAPTGGGDYGSTIHVRATIGGAAKAGTLTVTDTTTVIATSTACAIDGPSIAVASDGRVHDATGRDNSHGTLCDMDIYTASPADDGSSPWNPSFTHTGYYVVTPGETEAHQLVALGTGGDLVGAWPDLGDYMYYAGLSWQKTTGGVWPSVTTPAGEVFPVPDGGSTALGFDNWSLCRLSDTEIHAVGHLDASSSAATFQHSVYDGTSWHQGQPTPPFIQSPDDDGLVLVSGADPAQGMLAFAVSTDHTTLYAAKWAGGTWLPASWRSFAVGSAYALAGSGCGSTHPMVFWTDTTNTRIVGADVSGLLQ